MIYAKFRCLHKTGGVLKLSPATCCDVIMACAVLHNMAILAGLELPEVIPDEEIILALLECKIVSLLYENPISF